LRVSVANRKDHSTIPPVNNNQIRRQEVTRQAAKAALDAKRNVDAVAAENMATIGMKQTPIEISRYSSMPLGKGIALQKPSKSNRASSAAQKTRQSDHARLLANLTWPRKKAIITSRESPRTSPR
jgi:hypothetical protein